MPRQLVECVPNFSEGRDPAKIDAIVESILAVPEVVLLDRESDADHNRSVLTFVGPPAAVAEAALRSVEKAVALIDLTRHQGAHPRIGAADVIPFIPIEGVTLEDCVRLAERVGQQIWERFRVPGVSLRSGGAAAGAHQSGEHPPRPVRGAGARDGRGTGARAGLRRAALPPDRRRHGGGRAQVPDRLQHQPGDAGRGDRQEDRQDDSLLDRRFPLREIDGGDAGVAQPGAGLHQSDGFRADAHAPGVRNRAARGQALRRAGGGQRDCGTDSEEGHRDVRRIFPALREFPSGAGAGEPHRRGAGGAQRLAGVSGCAGRSHGDAGRRQRVGGRGGHGGRAGRHGDAAGQAG